MIRKIIKNIPFSYDEKFILAISSGKDSCCLYDILKQKYKNIILVHINHQKRKESFEEEEYLIKLAKENNHKIYTAKFNYEKNNFQKEARKFRYNLLFKVAKAENVKYILTAHHLNDQAETIIEKIIKGSSLYGYSGISLSYKVNDFVILRPMINVSVEEIKEYIKKNNIKYYEDSSNSSSDYLRNRIRHNIIPLLEKEEINFLSKINEYHTILKEAHDFIRKRTISRYQKEIDLLSFKSLDLAEQKDLIIYYLEKERLHKNYHQINLIYNFLVSKKTNCYFYLNQNKYLVKESNKCYFKDKIDEEKILDKQIEIKEFNKVYSYYNYKIELTKIKPKSTENYYKLCYNQLKLPLVVRTRRKSDILEFDYGKKTLKKLLIEKKIKKDRRYQIPLIVANNQILIVDKLYQMKQKIEKKIYLKIEESYE